MMDRADCKAMLTRLGWNDDASSSMYDDQAINSIDKFRYLDDESVKTLCKVLCRPWGATTTIATKPGVKVNARAASNLILTVYLIKHQDRVYIDVAFRNVTLEGVRKLSGQHEMEEDSMEVSVTTPTVHTKDWLKTLEGVEEYLRTFRGVNGTPLSYVCFSRRYKLLPHDI